MNGNQSTPRRGKKAAARTETDGSGDIQIDGTLTRSMAVCDGARLSVSCIEDNQVFVDVSSDDGLSQSRLFLSLDEADELADQLREKVAEARND